MGKSLRFWILAFAIAGFTFAVYSQGPLHGPPEPTTAANQGNGNGRPCGRPGQGNQGNGQGNGNGPGIPPPVGLCLPINDYLLPLLLTGIAFGSYMVWRIEKTT